MLQGRPGQVGRGRKSRRCSWKPGLDPSHKLSCGRRGHVSVGWRDGGALPREMTRFDPVATGEGPACVAVGATLVLAADCASASRRAVLTSEMLQCCITTEGRRSYATALVRGGTSRRRWRGGLDSAVAFMFHYFRAHSSARDVMLLLSEREHCEELSSCGVVRQPKESRTGAKRVS